MTTQQDGSHDAEVQTASVTPLVVYDVTKAQIAELREQFSGITFETTSKYEEGRKAIATLRDLRGKVEAKRVQLKAPALAYGQKVDSVAKELTVEIESVETPLKLLKSAVDEEKERAKREAEEAKRAELAAKIKAEREAEEARLRAEREAAEAADERAHSGK
jgi:colicin import membrane protein